MEQIGLILIFLLTVVKWPMAGSKLSSSKELEKNKVKIERIFFFFLSPHFFFFLTGPLRDGCWWCWVTSISASFYRGHHHHLHNTHRESEGLLYRAKLLYIPHQCKYLSRTYTHTKAGLLRWIEIHSRMGEKREEKKKENLKKGKLRMILYWLFDLLKK